MRMSDGIIIYGPGDEDQFPIRIGDIDWERLSWFFGCLKKGTKVVLTKGTVNLESNVVVTIE
jgi:hypothetical protein